MCTVGGISTAEAVVVGKTIDMPPGPLWFGRLKGLKGLDILGCVIPQQGGVNIGLNEAGLGAALAFYSAGPAQRAPFQGDPRGLINQEVLERCGTVKQAVAHLVAKVRQAPPEVGGIHLLVDLHGEIGVVEYAEGEVAYGYYPNFAVRANTADWLPPDERTPPEARTDRETRREYLLAALQRLHVRASRPGGTPVTIVREFQQLLSSHCGEEKGQGSICCHGLNIPNARLNGNGVVVTVAGIVLDVTRRTMWYATGLPCSVPWHHQTM